MLAQNILNQLDERIKTYSDEISKLERQAESLREERKVAENERQALQTLVGAGESAIEQARNFLNLANRANRGDMIESFWEEMEGLKGMSAIADLPEDDDPEDCNQFYPDGTIVTIINGEYKGDKCEVTGYAGKGWYLFGEDGWECHESDFSVSLVAEPNSTYTNGDIVEIIAGEFKGTITSVAKYLGEARYLLENGCEVSFGEIVLYEGEENEIVMEDLDNFEMNLPKIPVQPQAAGADVLDFGEMSMPELKEECRARGIDKNTVKRYGTLSRKSTWIAALKAIR